MRYWHPFSSGGGACGEGVAAGPVVLLPLYPQFSTTTTGSSLAAWRQAAARTGLAGRDDDVCCYPMTWRSRPRQRPLGKGGV